MLVVNILIYGFGAHIFLNSVFPNQYQSMLLNISFNLILMYSYAEFYLSKIYNSDQFLKIKNMIESINKKTNINEIEVIKNGSIICSYSTSKKNIKVEDLPSLDYDLIIVSNYFEEPNTESSQKINKAIYYKYNDDDKDKQLEHDYIKCKLSFISVNVKIIRNEKEELYSISLSNDNENYYIVGNKINKLFIYYLMKKQYNVIFGEYKLIVIDQNANIKTFSEKEGIIFNENDYSVN
jgi:hypothetical protein